MIDLNVNVNPGFTARIDSSSSRLRGAEKKIVEFIKKNKEEIIHWSITEVAERSDTSESSVVRLCKRLGYKGFQDLKIHLAKEVVIPDKDVNQEIKEEDDVASIKRKVFQANIQSLYDSVEVCNDEELQRAVEAFLNANVIDLYGTGASGIVAKDAQHKLLKLGVRAFTHSDITMQVMSASVLRENDVVVGISHTGSNTDVLNAMKLAKDAGATLICITNSSKSPITKISDITLQTSINETLYRTDSLARIAQLTIIDILVAAIANQQLDHFYSNVQKTSSSTLDRKL